MAKEKKTHSEGSEKPSEQRAVSFAISISSYRMSNLVTDDLPLNASPLDNVPQQEVAHFVSHVEEQKVLNGWLQSRTPSQMIRLARLDRGTETGPDWTDL
jgi:hypothetical protein